MTGFFREGKGGTTSIGNARWIERIPAGLRSLSASSRCGTVVGDGDHAFSIEIRQANVHAAPVAGAMALLVPRRAGLSDTVQAAFAANSICRGLIWTSMAGQIRVPRTGKTSLLATHQVLWFEENIGPQVRN